MKRRYGYQYKLSDNSGSTWLTDVIPKKAGYALADRFPGRRVISIKRIN